MAGPGLHMVYTLDRALCHARIALVLVLALALVLVFLFQSNHGCVWRDRIGEQQ